MIERRLVLIGWSCDQHLLDGFLGQRNAARLTRVDQRTQRRRAFADVFRGMSMRWGREKILVR